MVNTPITLSAEATGSANVQYQFWVYNPAATPAWSQLQAAPVSATCPWTPATAGPYLLSVTALDGATDLEVSAASWYVVTAGVPLTGVTLTPSPAAPQPAHTVITLTANATGGTNVQYQFWIYDPAAAPAWSQLQTYSTSADCTWTPASAGPYLLSVTALDGAGGLEVNATCWYAVTGGAALTGVTLTPSLAAPQPVNTPITLTASAMGGTNVQYQFWVYNPAATPAWSQLQAYSASAACLWTPASAGPYLQSVTAQDGVTGNEVGQTLWYTISGQ